MQEWNKEQAESTYKINRWGDGFFGITDDGKLCVLTEKREDGPKIVIDEVVAEMKKQGVRLPTVIRFHDILRAQVANINKTFRDVIDEAKYEGRYYGVYPIKVNQMREVVEEIVDAGTKFDFGLEAGSKAELLSVLAHNENSQALTVLNGYKDKDYMRLAMLGRKLGRKVIVVIEKFSELKLCLDIAKEMDVTPLIGLRSKLAAQGAGKWMTSSGDRAKFGLSAAEVLQAIELLKAEDKLESLKLFHFHVGSQVTDIRTLKDAMTEGARIYSKLFKLGAPIEYFDVGGGLGVDYDGTKSTNDSSINYDLRDYVSDIVYILKQVCDLEQVPHPFIVSESGRAITAGHSCVVTNVFDKIEVNAQNFNTGKVSGEHIIVTNMRDLANDLSEENYLETYYDALQYKNECLNAFKLGVLNLEERAKVESLHWEVLKKIRLISKTLDESEIPDVIFDLDAKLATQYLCNLSVFQSLPDTWAIGQLLPVVPLTRLNERPDQFCTLADITCDSDGKIDKFIVEDDDNRMIPLHSFEPGEEYNIGVFMTGAYQDVMGDNHNLFGRVNEVHVFCDPSDPQGFYIEEVIQGGSCQSVLSTMQYSSYSMVKTIKRELDRQIKRGQILPREGIRLSDFYEKCLRSYTYLSHSD